MRSVIMINVLSSGLGKFLGSVSFPLYLIHVPIIYTLLAKGYVHVNHSPLQLSVLLTSFFLLLFAAAFCAEKYIERPFLFLLGMLRYKLKELGGLTARPMSEGQSYSSQSRR